ncbi:hypothetical protein [Helicobacter sp. T3_23-1059]
MQALSTHNATKIQTSKCRLAMAFLCGSDFASRANNIVANGGANGE